MRFFMSGRDKPSVFIQGGNACPCGLRCEECKQRNYNTVKNKKNTSDRLERSKYCPFCRKHTKHVESK